MNKIDEEIRENKELLKYHLDCLENGEVEVMYICSRIANKLNQLFREKLGFQDFSGKDKDE